MQRAAVPSESATEFRARGLQANEDGGSGCCARSGLNTKDNRTIFSGHCCEGRACAGRHLHGMRSRAARGAGLRAHGDGLLVVTILHFSCDGEVQKSESVDK